ncbi:MAG: hypothetical protein ABI862_19725 [Ilumatobacteraceae bacterium]
MDAETTAKTEPAKPVVKSPFLTAAESAECCRILGIPAPRP